MRAFAALSLVLMSLLLVAAPASALDPPGEIQVQFVSDYTIVQNIDLFVGLQVVAEFNHSVLNFEPSAVRAPTAMEVGQFMYSTKPSIRANRRLTRRLPQ